MSRETKIIVLIIMLAIPFVSFTVTEVVTHNLQSEDPEVTTEKITKVERSWRTKYYRCAKSKRILVPIPIYQNAHGDECKEELEKARTALKGIKSWCDPYCRVELEGCMKALHPVGYYNLEEI